MKDVRQAHRVLGLDLGFRVYMRTRTLYLSLSLSLSCVLCVRQEKSLQNDAADCSVCIREGLVHIYISDFGTVSAMITVRAVETFWVSEPL